MHQTTGTDNVAYSFVQLHHKHAINNLLANFLGCSFLNCKLNPISFHVQDNTFKITIPGGTWLTNYTDTIRTKSFGKL